MKMRIHHFFTLLLLFFVGFAAEAQTGIVRGFVYVKETGEPEPFVTVYLDEDAKYGATTDVNGCLLYTSPSPRDGATSRMPSSA